MVSPRSRPRRRMSSPNLASLSGRSFIDHAFLEKTRPSFAPSPLGEGWGEGPIAASLPGTPRTPPSSNAAKTRRTDSMTALPAAKLDPKMPDADLARAVASGNHDAMRILMRRYNQTLFRTARAILRDDAEAEDAVQEAYMSAYRSIARYRAESKLSTWLVRITVNESLARLRKTRRSAHVISMEGDERIQRRRASRN